MFYDGIIFGNGMTLNLLCQLRGSIPNDKMYLLDINDFLKQWIAGGLTQREERIFYSALYGNKKDEGIYFEKLKNGFAKYYEKYDADIEYILGLLLFTESEYKEIIQIFPAVYNIWNIVLSDYLRYRNCSVQIEKYYESVRKVIGNTENIWTTNFDLFAESLKPKHLHGKFLAEIKKYEDVIYEFFDNGKQYYFKYIWGHNGIGKFNNIQQLKQFMDYDKFFDFDFFFDNEIRIKRLLIYGMGFKNSGYIEKLKTQYPRYESAALGGIIDEHILLRISGLQNLGLLEEVDVTYFDAMEKKHLEEVLKETKIKNWNLINCHDFAFRIS